MPKTKITKEQDIIIKELYLSGMTSQQIADQFLVYKQSILNSLKRSGVERIKTWKRASGDKNGKWKGGIRMVKGYRHVYLPGHRLARKDGWVAEHRLLVEEKIINKTQVVHHKDNNRLNNNKNNLEVFSSNSEHRKEHCKTDLRDKKGKFMFK
jgi:hypothetical protein